MNIQDQIIVVTGANRGLGRALVGAALRAGARRVYAGAREPAQLDALVGESGGRVIPLRIDVTREDSLLAAAERAPDVTLLINNAGVVASHHVLSSSPRSLQQDFDTNVFGLLATTRAFLPALERAASVERHSAIVNVLSVVSLASMPSLGGYSASKAAAYSVTQALRADLAARHVDVHAVFAGAMDTDMTREMSIPKARPEDVAQAMLRAIAAGTEDIFPDSMSEGLSAVWRSDPKALERQLSGFSG